MAHYLILESRDPYDSGDWQNMQQIAKDMQSRGNGVTVFLVQNGVIPARKGDRYSASFAELQKLGITILADDFSLKERAIDELAEGVNTADMDRLVQLSLQGDTKTIWH
ncbi:MAG: DsrE family protein [Cyanobacteria bacterium SBLK]|nr:DsrE family protein [Cyanobacteria bacterium SBLK]